MLLWWQPEGFDPSKGITLVSLHGSTGWVTRDFQVWHKHLQEKGWAYLGLQWWDGRGDRDYLAPHDIAEYLRWALFRYKVKPGRAVLTGFSRGSANSYSVAYLDRQDDDAPFFGAVISNSGEMTRDFPPNRPFLGAAADKRPFEGLPWVLYCGEKDLERPQACEAMEWTRQELSRGGAVVEVLRDPDGAHGGMMKPAMNRRVTDAVSRLLEA